MTELTDKVLHLTAQIVTAYLDANTVATDAVSALIQNVHQSLSRANRGVDDSPPKPPSSKPRSPGTPAVDIQKSVFPDHLICLEDARSFKTLKRHLGEAHGMTPDQYREKWSLPRHYPMLAPNYAAVRSKLAKAKGLGKRASR